jgi:uridine kinase
MFALLPPFHSLMDVAVFVDTDLEECYRRRLYRDVEQRGRTKESVHVQWNRTVVQGYRDFIEPTKDHAHVVLTHETPLSKQVEEVLSHLTLFERTRVS